MPLGYRGLQVGPHLDEKLAQRTDCSAWDQGSKPHKESTPFRPDRHVANLIMVKFTIDATQRTKYNEGMEMLKEFAKTVFRQRHGYE